MTTFEARTTAQSFTPRPFAVTPKKADVLDLLVRVAVAQAYAHTHDVTIDGARQFLARKFARYGDEATKAFCDYAAKGISVPATTYLSGWAAELVGQSHADVIGAIMPLSGYAQLAALGLSLQFGRDGRIAVPSFSPSIAGVFVREGEPIPVARGETTGQFLTRRKLAVITTFTSEINDSSVPAIEGLLRARIQESTGMALDGVLFDAEPISDHRPAGLLHEAAELDSSGGVQGDLQMLADALAEATHHHIRNFVLVLNPGQAFAMRLETDEDVCPIVVSSGVPPGTVIMLDASDFVCAGGDPPRFDISGQAALHMEDEAPRPLANGGQANPIRSLWQTNTLGLRMILQVDWCLRRPQAVAFMRDVWWHAGGGEPVVSTRPRVTAISPNTGPAAGGTSVLLTGQHFSGATVVNFGSNPAAFTINNDNQITATSPAGTGAVNITVITPEGISATGAANRFTYLAPPVPAVTGVSPNSGPPAGGTSVTITGNNFVGVTGVAFGANAASSFTVNNINQIVATAPAGTGTVNVRVTNAEGTSAIATANQFTYVVPLPTITSLNPNTGPAAGGTNITITGTNLSGATAVRFGATAATSFTVDSATQIIATSPAGSGNVNVTVTTPDGTSAGASFTYVAPPAPTVTNVNPNTGPAAGGTNVIITGTHLSGASAVSFGANAAASFTVDSATQIAATSPAGTGTVNVRVTTPDGMSATATANQFLYVVPVPTVTGLSPNNGPIAGGTSVVITGTNFTGATAVAFGANAATSFTVNSPTQITAVSPAGAAGTVNVRVTTPDGTSTTATANQFTYSAPPLPTVTGLSPNNGPAAGGTNVVITGTGFTGASAVVFGTNAATSFNVDSATQITAVSPAGSGAVNVRVTTPDGTSVTAAGNQFTYAAPPVLTPTVTSLSPNTGPMAGGTAVTITGTNLTGATAVSFGAVPATSFTVNSATQITATSPAGSGNVNVTVTTPEGTSATAPGNQFTYSAPPLPTITSLTPNVGEEAGGTSVVITGTNLSGATAVSFGANAAASFTVDSATQITAISPAGTGNVNVTVTTPNGTSGGLQFAYTSVTSNEAIALFQAFPTGSYPPPAAEGTLWFGPTGQSGFYIYIASGGFNQWQPI